MINNTTAWHATQKQRILTLLNRVEEWPQPLKALVGARLVNLTNAVESLHGRPKGDSNHSVVTRALTDMETAINAVQIKEPASAV